MTLTPPEERRVGGDDGPTWPEYLEDRGLPWLPRLAEIARGPIDLVKMTESWIARFPDQAAAPPVDGQPLADEPEPAAAPAVAEDLDPDPEPDQDGGGAWSIVEGEIRGMVRDRVRDGRGVNVAEFVAEYADQVGGPERVRALVEDEKRTATADRAEQERQTMADAAGREFKAVDAAIAGKDLKDAAIAKLKDDPISFIRDTFGTVHSGDQEVANVLTAAIGAQSCITTMGIQPAFAGPKGAGKTAAALAFVHLVPPEYVLKGSFSSKAIFYTDIRPGTILFSDDTTLSPEINDLTKRAMSDFQSPTPHHTLDIKRNPIPLMIPPRIIWLFTSIGDQGDEQLSDRQFKMSMSPDVDADKRYVEFMKERAAKGIPDYPVTRDVLICREMFRQVKGHLFAVEMPFMPHVEFTDLGNRRLNRGFVDFVAGVAAVRFMQRRQYRNDDDPEGVVRLVATEADLVTAAEIYNINRETKKFALTKDERGLWAYIWKHGRDHASSVIGRGGKALYEHEIIEHYALSSGDRKRDGTRTAVRRLLYGRPDRGQPGGITEKVPGCYKIDDHHEPGAKFAKKNLIVCVRGPELADYQTFYTFDHAAWEQNPAFTPDPLCPKCKDRCSQCSPVVP